MPSFENHDPLPSQRQLCIWFPNWPIQRWHHAHATGKKIPPDSAILLWKRDARRGRVVAACNGVASRRGVRQGMSYGETETLLHALDADKRFLQPWQPEDDLRALQQFAESASSWLTPLVALEPLQPQPWSGQMLHQPQALFLEMTHLDKLFGSEQQIMAHVQQWLAAWEVRGAMADTAGTAWAVAHFATADHPFRLVKSGCNRQALAALPPAALRLPSEAAENLQRLGIETIESLLRLPRAALASRFGNALLTRIDQALGHVSEPLVIHHQTAEDAAANELEYPTQDAAILKHRLQQLLEELCSRLSQRRRGALQLLCRLELTERAPLEFRLGLFAPTADVSHLTRLLHGRFDSQALAADVRRIQIAVPLTAPLRQYQASLLSDGADGLAADRTALRTELSQFIDLVSGRLGSEAVLGVSRGNDPLPEKAYSLSPLAGRPQAERPRQKRTRAATAQSDTACSPVPQPNVPHLPAPESPLRRPLSLLPEPEAIEVFERDEHGVPRRLRLSRSAEACGVVRYWGPERIESGWWRGETVRRDYYRMETESGQWLWVFRRLGENRWMLHGWFS